MQTVSQNDKSLIEGFHKIHLLLSADGIAFTGEIVNCVYHAAVGGGDGFSVGNACASYAELTIAGTGHNLSGKAAILDWAVDTATYPLILGMFGPSEESGGQTRITIYDALYTTGSDAYQTEAGNTTALALLVDVAAKLGTTLRAGRFADALASITVDASLLNGLSLSAVAGELALTVGASVIINRSGALALVGSPESSGYAMVITSDGLNLVESEGNAFYIRAFDGREYECYAGEGKTGAVYGVTGVTVAHDENAFKAGDGSLVLYSVLASQTVAENILSEWNATSWNKASGRIPGGLLLEPGDSIHIVAETASVGVLVHTLTLNLDGGCSATFESLGASPFETGGTSGRINQQLSTIKADLIEVRRLNADEAWVSRLFSNKITAETLDITAGDYTENGVAASLVLSQGEGAYTGGLTITAETEKTGERLLSSVGVSPDGTRIVGGATITKDLHVNGTVYTGKYNKPLVPVSTTTYNPIEIPAGADTVVGAFGFIGYESLPTVVVSIRRTSAASSNLGKLTAYTVWSGSSVEVHVANSHTAAFTVGVDVAIIESGV